MKRLLPILGPMLLAGCATALAPNPSVALAGEWEITAVGGPSAGAECISCRPGGSTSRRDFIIDS